MRSARTFNLTQSLVHDHGMPVMVSGILLSILGALSITDGPLTVPCIVIAIGAAIFLDGIRRLR